jgi:hypothetical protein
VFSKLSLVGHRDGTRISLLEPLLERSLRVLYGGTRVVSHSVLTVLHSILRVHFFQYRFYTILIQQKTNPYELLTVCRTMFCGISTFVPTKPNTVHFESDVSEETVRLILVL